MSALYECFTAAFNSEASSTNRCDVFMSTSYYGGSFNDVTGYFALVIVADVNEMSKLRQC